ncbi:MAG: prepilin-type N-terminal cleavage/methylation domain-containing protein, partial [Nitrospirae bacterium]|nr:prepilin-type N-terminal cleavage/methylation domain-containing protein [Nitrospirota bacterium]
MTRLRRKRHFFGNRRGFTLIEIAIVLIIIGFLLTIGAGMMGMLTKKAKLTETRETVKTAHESILGYV